MRPLEDFRSGKRRLTSLVRDLRTFDGDNLVAQRYSMNQADRRNELLNAMFRLKAAEFSRCFASPPVCPNSAIRAHSVQNARCLDLLAVDGHVVSPTIRLSAQKGPLVDLAPVGRNHATTFSGLCGAHDHEIFAPIEADFVDPNNPEHRFLLAYRATFYEVHATCAAAWQVQMGYQKRVELGLDPENEPSNAGVFAVDRMMVAYETYNYKELFDAAYHERQFGILTHDLVDLEVTEPTVAASALFSLDHLQRGDDVVRVCLTILPLDRSRTVALLSYLNSDASLARAQLSRVLTSSGDHQKYELSKRLLNNCHNFVLSPRYVTTWPPTKRRTITDFYVRTVIHDDLQFDDLDLMLFH